MSGGGRMTNMGWVPDEISFPGKQPTPSSSPVPTPSSTPPSPEPSPIPTSTAPGDTSGTSAPGGIVTGYDAAPNTPPGSTSCSGENPCPPPAPTPSATPTPTYTSQPPDIKVKDGYAIRTFTYNSSTNRWEDSGDHLEPAGNGEYYIVHNDEPAKEKPGLWQRIKDRAKQKLRDAMGPDAYDMIFSTPQPSNE